MKGVSVLVGAAILIAITLSAIFVALNMGQPAVDRTKEILVMQEGKSILIDIDNAINSVIVQGNMSTRQIEFRIIDGTLEVNEDDETVLFIMRSDAQIVGVGVSKIEDGINITGKTGEIEMFLSYDNIDLINSFKIGTGNRRITIRNEGYDSLTEKQILSIQ